MATGLSSQVAHRVGVRTASSRAVAVKKVAGVTHTGAKFESDDSRNVRFVGGKRMEVCSPLSPPSLPHQPSPALVVTAHFPSLFPHSSLYHRSSLRVDITTDMNTCCLTLLFGFWWCWAATLLVGGEWVLARTVNQWHVHSLHIHTVPGPILVWADCIHCTVGFP